MAGVYPVVLLLSTAHSTNPHRLLPPSFYQDSLVQLGFALLLYNVFNQSVLVQLWDKSIRHITSFAMSTTLESTTTNNRQPSVERKQSPPAFLDLADSVSSMQMYGFSGSWIEHFQAARYGNNMSDVSVVSAT